MLCSVFASRDDPQELSSWQPVSQFPMDVLSEQPQTSKPQETVRGQPSRLIQISTSNAAPSLHQTAHIQYQEEREKLNSEYQLVWTESMAGATRYSSVYRNVAALLISWHQDNDDLKVYEEVTSLQRTFQERYRFKASKVELTSSYGPRPQVQLNKEVANFVAREDKEHTLLIVYYAGHGHPGSSPGHLHLSGERSTSKTHHNYTNFPVIWNHTESILNDTHADILVIFDCCYAGDLGRFGGGLSTRSFEYLAATLPSGTTRSPGKASFTSALIWALEELLLKDPKPKFTTTELRLKIKEAPNFPKDQQPMLSSRDVSSTERIVLGPLPPSNEKPPNPEESSNSANTECLMLRCFFERTPTKEELKGLAHWLQRHISTQKSPLTRVAYGGLHSLEQRAALMFLERLNRKKSMEMISPSVQLSAALSDAPSKSSDQKLNVQQEAKPKPTNDSNCAGKEGEKELYNNEAVDESQTRGSNKRIKVIH